ncbi:hypothetical protein [Chryseobacterium echinoideorum]|uniref:hypothetical protein n=1 Tax=Chryseobacterium echinoideorum TaxID=1549648 RepID=UPI001186858D|nr:hypothetical protein [Chryseobacterium echinoideorum]
MKKRIFLFLLFCTLIVNAQTPVVIDLSTGRNDNDSLMNAPPPDVTGGFSVPDPDWSVLRPGETTPVSTKTRHTYPGWSYPQLSITGSSLRSRWITDKDGWFYVGDGYYYYYSKSFTIPNGVTDAVLNLRALSFVRNWTYLVRTDVSPNTEEQITRTLWLSDGAIGWLNSRNTEVINRPLAPGTYTIKVKIYTNNGNVTNAINVNSQVRYTPAGCVPPTTPTIGTITQPSCTTLTGSFIITNYDVNNTYTITPSIGVT